MSEISGYKYKSAGPTQANDMIHKYFDKKIAPRIMGANHHKILDFGCGNGWFLGQYIETGNELHGIDPSSSGIKIAKSTYPDLVFTQSSSNEVLNRYYEKFDIALSVEVIEHVYSPREYMQRLYDYLKPGGVVFLTTPFNGYWKNLAIALLGQFDKHYTALWDHGHIKFWSRSTLTKLVQEANFQIVDYGCLGRVPPIAKSMYFVLKK